MRDAESGVVVGAALLEWVDLGPCHDPDAEPDERDGSCVVISTDPPGGPKRILSRQQKSALYFLHHALDDHEVLPPTEVTKGAGKHGPKPGTTGCPVGVWRDLVKASGGLSDSGNPDTQDTAFRRALKELRDGGFIGVFQDWVWLTDKRS